MHAGAAAQRPPRTTVVSFRVRSLRRRGEGGRPWPPSFAKHHVSRDQRRIANDVSCVCGFRWSSRFAPATALSLRFQTIRPRLMSDS